MHVRHAHAGVKHVARTYIQHLCIYASIINALSLFVRGGRAAPTYIQHQSHLTALTSEHLACFQACEITCGIPTIFFTDCLDSDSRTTSSYSSSNSGSTVDLLLQQHARSRPSPDVPSRIQHISHCDSRLPRSRELITPIPPDHLGEPDSPYAI